MPWTVSFGRFGVVAFGVAERRREIAMRLVLGAEARGVVRLVLRYALGLALAGTAIGLVAAFGASRLLAGQLYEVAPTDALTFAGAAATLILLATLASYVPARRAARVDPVVVMREGS